MIFKLGAVVGSTWFPLVECGIDRLMTPSVHHYSSESVLFDWKVILISRRTRCIFKFNSQSATNYAFTVKTLVNPRGVLANLDLLEGGDVNLNSTANLSIE